MYRSLLILLFLCAGIRESIAQGQDETNSLAGVPLKDRIIFGGGLGLGFSTLQDHVMIAPSIGYMVTRKFVTGINITYRYTNYKYVNPSIAFSEYGGGPFLRYFVYRNIFLQTEYEYLNYEFISRGERRRDGFNSFLAGGGFIQPIGGKAYFYLMALYNFSYTNPAPGQYSPYPRPLMISAGINIGNFLSF